jgi:hypothetical protein
MANDKTTDPKPVVPPPPNAFYDFNKSTAPAAAVPQDTRAFPVGPTLTRQEFADECDINVLMERYQNRDIGAIMRAAGEPAYYDFASMPNTLMGFMKLTQDAENAFMTLPAQVRREFDNDPIAFVDYASDPSNLDQMRSWGLAPPAPSAPPGSLGGATPHSSLLDVTVRTDTKSPKPSKGNPDAPSQD